MYTATAKKEAIGGDEKQDSLNLGWRMGPGELCFSVNCAILRRTR